MAAPPVQQITGDVLVLGNIIANGLIPGGNAAGYITDKLIATSAGIANTKVQQQVVLREVISNYGSSPSSVRKTLAIVSGATGSITAFKVTLAQALASGSFTVDLLKNGTTVLSAAVTVNSTGGTGGTAYDKIAGVITSPTLAAGDVLEINVTPSTPSGGGGAMAEVVFSQDPA